MHPWNKVRHHVQAQIKTTMVNARDNCNLYFVRAWAKLRTKNGADLESVYIALNRRSFTRGLDYIAVAGLEVLGSFVISYHLWWNGIPRTESLVRWGDYKHAPQWLHEGPIGSLELVHGMVLKPRNARNFVMKLGRVSLSFIKSLSSSTQILYYLVPRMWNIVVLNCEPKFDKIRKRSAKT